VARVRDSDLEHNQTPAGQRGALWWLEEHGAAEHAVTSASLALDSATSDHERALWSRLFDERLDHLEAVEDECDRILAALRESAQPWVAGAVAAHWTGAHPLVAVADELGMSYAYASRAIRAALRRLDAGRGVSES